MTGPYPDQNPTPGTPATPGKEKRRIGAAQIIGLLLLVIVVVFIVENTNKVPVRLIFPQVHAPLYVALLIAAGLGVLGTLLIQYRRRHK